MSPAYVFLVTAPVPELSQLDRLEQKVDTLTRLVRTLVDALAQDEGDPADHPALTLDGEQAGQERDQGQSLG